MDAHSNMPNPHANVESESPIETVIEILSAYGWYLVFAAIGLYLVWARFAEPQWRWWMQQRVQFQEADRMHRDPDGILRRQEAMEAARRRLQEQHDKLAQAHAEKMKEKEEERRRQKIEEWEKLQQGKGFFSKHRVHDAEPNNSASTSDGSASKKTGSTSKGSLRPEYNPLMGSGGGTCYRPARRGGARGGG